MYLPYSNFQVLFKNVDITEAEYNVYEPNAEALIFNYTGQAFAEVPKDVSYATGLIVQRLVAISNQPPDAAKTYSEGGVSTTYGKLEVIPGEAKKILDRYVKPENVI